MAPHVLRKFGRTTAPVGGLPLPHRVPGEDVRGGPAHRAVSDAAGAAGYGYDVHGVSPSAIGCPPEAASH